MTNTVQPNNRRGVTLLECVASLAMLGVLLGLIAQTTVLVDRQGAAQWRTRVASATLTNLMEHAAGAAWDQIDQESLQASLEPLVRQSGLPGAELSVRVEESTEELPEKRLTLTLSWPGGPPSERQRLSLTHYFYAAAEDDL